MQNDSPGATQQLRIRDEGAISGLPTCPACGGVLHGDIYCPHCGANTVHPKSAPRAKLVFPREPCSDKSRISFLVMFLCCIAALGAVFWPIKAPPNYFEQLQNLWRQAASPLEEEHGDLSGKLASFQTLCEQRIQAKGPDVNAARAAHRISECLSGICRERATYRNQWEAARHLKVLTPSESDGGSHIPNAKGTEGNIAQREQAERMAKVQAAVEERWQKTVARLRVDCTDELPLLQRAMRESYLQFLKPTDSGTVYAWQWIYALHVKPWWDQTFLRSRAKEGVAQIPCTACNGSGWNRCSVCGGSGSVEGTSVSVCSQCNGTGSYKLKVSSGKARCPFCRGTGQITKSVMQPCAACEAKGIVPCTACAGKGVVADTTAKAD